MKKAGFKTCKSHVHFFSQVYVETGGYNKLSENPNYRYEAILKKHSKKTLAKIFFSQSFFDNNNHLDYFQFKVYKNVDSNGTHTGKALKTFKWKNSSTDTVRVPLTYSRDKQQKSRFNLVHFKKDEKEERNKKLFSVIYGNKYGNGDATTEDGYNYRGKGAIHLTWKENYQKVTSTANTLFSESFDWVNHPDYLENNEKDAVYSAAAYFYFRLKKDISKLDNYTIRQASYNVNGGYNGINDREDQYDRISELNFYNLNQCKEPSEDNESKRPLKKNQK